MCGVNVRLLRGALIGELRGSKIRTVATKPFQALATPRKVEPLATYQATEGGTLWSVVGYLRASWGLLRYRLSIRYV